MYAPCGNGPVTALANPTGADTCFDNVSYPSENDNDNDNYNSGDGWAHFRVTPAEVGVSQSISWTILPNPPATTGVSVHAAEFLPGPVASSTTLAGGSGLIMM
jgi:hypothetical protein